MCLSSSNTQANNNKSSSTQTINKEKYVEHRLKAKRKHRYKLWELHHRYHCSVLGTCLTIKELRQVATKLKMSDARTLNDYDLHISFVCNVTDKAYVGRLINKLLDKKFKGIIQQFAKTKTENERQNRWQEAIKTGDIAGAFWALISHPESSEAMLYQAYGEVHMLSHIASASLRFDQQSLHQIKKQHVTLKKTLKQNKTTETQRIQNKNTEINSLKTQLHAAKSDNKILLVMKKTFEQLTKKPILTTLQGQLDKLRLDHKQLLVRTQHTKKAKQQWQQQAKYYQAQQYDLAQKYTTIKQEKEILERYLIRYFKTEDTTVNNCSSSLNTETDLCGRCVLYVGGRNGQQNHFRQLVEQQNGQFIHHDGGREDSYQCLTGHLSKADIVLCPLDCVSHSAVNTVKRYCKNHTKSLVFIPHASLSSFAKGLDDVIN